MMVDVVTNSGTRAAVNPPAQQPVHVSASTPDNAAQKPVVATTQPSSNSLTGRLFEDPLAGIVVSQELDTNGYVVQQAPSSSVLAYLRNGLTIDGFQKSTTTTA